MPSRVHVQLCWHARVCQSLSVRDGLIAEDIKLGGFDVGVRQVAKVVGSGRGGIGTDTLFACVVSEQGFPAGGIVVVAEYQKRDEPGIWFWHPIIEHRVDQYLLG